MLFDMHRLVHCTWLHCTSDYQHESDQSVGYVPSDTGNNTLKYCYKACDLCFVNMDVTDAPIMYVIRSEA